jgi:hypothetical protein
MEFEAPTNLSKESHLHHDFTPLKWEEFFAEKRLLTVGEDRFNVYLKGNSGPVFLLLHGRFCCVVILTVFSV